MVSCLFALVDLAMYNHALEEQLEEIEELRRDELICLPDDLEYERYFQGTLKIFLYSFIHLFIQEFVKRPFKLSTHWCSRLLADPDIWLEVASGHGSRYSVTVRMRTGHSPSYSK